MRSITLLILFIAFVGISALWAQTAAPTAPNYISMTTEELKVLADKKDAEACYQLGYNKYNEAEAYYDEYYDYYYDEYDDYEEDPSTDPAYAEALEWFIKAANLGHKVALNYIGIMYKYGEGTQINYPEAVKWYIKAAANNNKYAQYNLGNNFNEGWVGTKDQVKAAEWYLKAALNLHPWSQDIMADRYQEGNGVTKDIQKAYYWSYVATKYGDEEVKTDADARNLILIPLLTATQKAKIEKDADAWVAKHPMPEGE